MDTRGIMLFRSTIQTGRRGCRPVGKFPIRIAALLVGLATGSVEAGSRDLLRNEAAIEQANLDLARLEGNFAQHETAHYVILYDCDESLAIQRGQLLEKLHRSYFAFLKKMRIRHHGLQYKQIVIVFEDDKGFNAYARAEGMEPPSGDGYYLQGYYSSGTNRAAFFNQRAGGAYEASKRKIEDVARQLAAIPGPKNRLVTVVGPKGPMRVTKGSLADDLVELKERLIKRFENENLTVTQHEGAHQLAFNTGLQSRDHTYPFWVSEGLACMFESPGSNKGFGAFRVNSKRLGDYRVALARDSVLGLRGLVSVVPGERVILTDLYAESWALFFFLAKKHPQELSAYLDDLSDREQIGEPNPATERLLFERHFKLDESRMEIRWRSFLRALR